MLIAIMHVFFDAKINTMQWGSDKIHANYYQISYVDAL